MSEERAISEQAECEKRPYARPELTEYGQVRRLTLQTSGQPILRDHPNIDWDKQ